MNRNPNRTMRAVEMENSRRSAGLNRMPEPGSKKPRLDDASLSLNLNRERAQFAGVRGGGGGSTAATPAYTPSSVPAYEPNSTGNSGYSELVGQYKAALAELTINSKPIITNLTIIAGENVHAAKSIAYTICANILEVPIAQKLPSLYLLDSIVKNIGGEYIKYFSLRLPEVFCKAYKLVDPTLQSSMQHLFGTWRGVFPSATLQAIEKELALNSNGPSSSAASTGATGTVAKGEPPHSIHVNPKYLEARHQQQQRVPPLIKGVQGVRGDELNATADPNTRVQRPERPAMDKSSLKWTQVSASTRPMQPRVSTEVLGISKRPEIGPVRRLASERVRMGRPTDGMFDAPKEIGDGGASSKSWKNSEEEEYNWDDYNGNSNVINNIKREDGSVGKGKLVMQRGKMLQPDGAPSINNSFKNDSPAPRVNKKGVHDPRLLSSKILEEHVTHLQPKQEPISNVDLEMIRESIRQHGSSSQWTPHEPSLAPPRVSVHSEEKQPAPPPRSLVGKLAPTARGPLRISNAIPAREPRNSKAAASNPMGESFVHEQRQRYVPASPSSSEHDYFQQPELGMQKHLHSSTPAQVARPVKPPLQSPSSSSTSSEPFPDLKPGITPFSRSKQHASSPPIFKPTVPLHYPTPKDGPHSTEVASIFRKGDSTNNNQSMNHLTDLVGSLHPLQSDPPTSNRSSAPGAPSVIKHAYQTSGGPPLPPGPPPTSSVIREDISFSSLLSTLVAKGLIASPSTTKQTPVPSINQTDDSKLIEEDPVEVKSATKETNLIGYEFKPEVMREYHPNVVNSLFDEMPHQCHKCGVRFEMKDQFESHLEWHESDKPCSSCYEHSLGISRKWYIDSDRWVVGSSGTEIDQQAGPIDALLEDDGWLEEERSGPMVPADENQILCVLCGDAFEDVYCFDNEEWMYRDAAYLDVECSVEGRIIVHDKCAAFSR